MSDTRLGTRLAPAPAEVTTMDPDNIGKTPRHDPKEDEEFVPGPLDDPSEADDRNESIEDPDADDEEGDNDEGID